MDPYEKIKQLEAIYPSKISTDNQQLNYGERSVSYQDIPRVSASPDMSNLDPFSDDDYTSLKTPRAIETIDEDVAPLQPVVNRRTMAPGLPAITAPTTTINMDVTPQFLPFQAFGMTDKSAEPAPTIDPQESEQVEEHKNYMDLSNVNQRGEFSGAISENYNSESVLIPVQDEFRENLETMEDIPESCGESSAFSTTYQESRESIVESVDAMDIVDVSSPRAIRQIKRDAKKKEANENIANNKLSKTRGKNIAKPKKAGRKETANEKNERKIYELKSEAEKMNNPDYRHIRDKNNESVKRSRAKKAKENKEKEERIQKEFLDLKSTVELLRRENESLKCQLGAANKKLHGCRCGAM